MLLSTGGKTDIGTRLDGIITSFALGGHRIQRTGTGSVDPIDTKAGDRTVKSLKTP